MDRKRSAYEFFNEGDRFIPSGKQRRKTFSENPVNESSASNTSWTPDVHRAFVEAILLHGMNRASPNIIAQHMIIKDDSLTAERIKSHLQKFRKNKDKSIREFMTEYDAYLSQRIGVPLAYTRQREISELSGGEIAAHLTFASLVESGTTGETRFPQRQHLVFPGNKFRASSRELSYMEYISSRGMNLPYPNLTPEEAQTPIGVALQHVVGVIEAMNEQLMITRRSTVSSGTRTSVGAESSLAMYRQMPVQAIFPNPRAEENISEDQRRALEEQDLAERFLALGEQSDASNPTFSNYDDSDQDDPIFPG